MTAKRSEAMSYNVGASDYSKHRIQPWDIWEEYGLNPWDADIIKRVLRTKAGEDRKLDYEKIIHICKKRIEQLENGVQVDKVFPPVDDLQVRIILEEGGILPQKATDGSAGYDLFAPEHVVINPGRNLVKLNFRLALPKGIGATPESRSGFTLKGFEGYRQYGTVGNSNDDAKLVPMGEPSRMDADVKWGLIDSDYRGVCGVLVISHEKEPFLLAKGTKFAQMCFQRYEDVDFIPATELDDTARKGGFGHTGTK
ncbi:MAG: hypothetical protein IJ456_01290 [Bacteroides sp.]|nr:hypothetical protein [Bacteroides sp.]